MNKFMKIFMTMSLAAAISALAQDNVKVDPAIPKYKKTSGVSGSVGSIG